MHEARHFLRASRTSQSKDNVVSKLDHRLNLSNVFLFSLLSLETKYFQACTVGHFPFARSDRTDQILDEYQNYLLQVSAHYLLKVSWLEIVIRALGILITDGSDRTNGKSQQTETTTCLVELQFVRFCVSLLKISGMVGYVLSRVEKFVNEMGRIQREYSKSFKICILFKIQGIYFRKKTLHYLQKELVT